MKAFAYSLIIICLCLGALSATTAYSPTLDSLLEAMQDDSAVLSLAAPAGLNKEAPAVDGIYPPLMTPKNTKHLKPEHIVQLRENDVERVRIKEFAMGRWSHAWLFFLAVAGLITGGLLVKREIKLEVQAQLAAGSAAGESPEDAIREIKHALTGLMLIIEEAKSPGEKLQNIGRVLEDLQKNQIERVVDARALLISQFGLRGFAEFMDAFADLERRINRAWSAAADGVLEEALDCVAGACARVDAVEACLHRD